MNRLKKRTRLAIDTPFFYFYSRPCCASRSLLCESLPFGVVTHTDESNFQLVTSPSGTLKLGASALCQSPPLNAQDIAPGLVARSLTVWATPAAFKAGEIFGGSMSCNVADFKNAFAANAKGGTLTRARALTTWNNLNKFSKERKMILSPEKITTKQIYRYVQWRQESGISPRTVQNEISHIRRALRGVGRDLGDLFDPKNNFSSVRLGMEKGTRTNKSPPADTALIEKIERPDIKAACRLQVALGLRQAEAIQSGKSLSTWKTKLTAAHRDGRAVFLEVRDGTKGGRCRTTYLPAHAVAAALQAVKDALPFVHREHLIEASTLKAARKAYERACSTAGFASHGLRRDFAVRQYLYYRGEHNEREALRLLCQDLGHGDGRGRWVKGNYLGVLYAED